MGVGVGKGENRAVEAVKKACHSPLQEKIVIDGARGVLINITGGSDITMHEINEATSMVYESADPNADIIFGVVIDEKMADEMRVTIIATGFAEASDSAPLASRRVRSVRNLFDSSEPLGGGDDQGAGREEPDPTPALDRKRERKREAAATKPNLDFDRTDNPLRTWDKSEGSDGDQDTDETETASSQPPVFNESTPAEHAQARVNPSSEEDPYDIPALQRRRRSRFFD
jgi:hypothetical protein